MNKAALVVFFLSASLLCQGQGGTQAISGTVIDKETQLPVPGATVYVKDTDPLIGTITDNFGRYKLTNVPLGRREVVCTSVGYSTYISEALIVTSAKAILLDIQLVLGLEIEGVTVMAIKTISEPVNELAVVSARSFTAEEATRFPTGLNDVSRMALSFPGVQQGRLDSENDIIVRGNSSFGMIWRLEGLDISAPSHFARVGTSGGGISILSAQLMGRSDFYIGGMPAEFGNTISAAMDVRLKNGNLNNYEHRSKLSFIGLDYALEGPIKKERSSFIFNARYSTLGLLNRMGFFVVAENAWNEFGDISFNLYFDHPEKNSKTNVFGMAGASVERLMPYYPISERDPGIRWHFLDQNLGSNMGVVGIVHKKVFNSKTHLRISAAVNRNTNFIRHDSLGVDDTPFRYEHTEYLENRITANTVLTRKITNRWKVKTGIIGTLMNYEFYLRNVPLTGIDQLGEGVNKYLAVDEAGISGIGQAYLQSTYYLTSKIMVSGGFHFIWLELNNTGSIDPRISLKYQANENNTISLAIGKYSQSLPLPAYYYQQSDTLSNGSVVRNYPNFDLEFIHSNHYILSHQYTTPDKLKVSTEVYYQSIAKGPVATDPENLYYFLNNMTSFPAFDVESSGQGYNYGIDVGVEKLFSNDFYFLVTGSLYQSKYRAANGNIYNSRFNGVYLTAVTAGKEFKVGSGVLQVGSRFTCNGGYRYTPHDPVLSAEAGRFVALEGKEMTGQIPAYWKFDGRIGYRFNRPTWAMNISADVSNFTGHRNANDAGYNPVTNEVFYHYHAGVDLIPLLSIQVDF